MFVKMKYELIALYYQLLKCCNKVQHKSLEGILTAKITKQLVELLTILKKKIFFLCMYKWLILTKKHMKIMA